ncbi:MAG: YggS family pyridoxal phosphate-dependent enzyme [Clostridiales bacterium]|nr:YggS family pyridoxal phosphate-dependent enzyme [Clostridiales bacterium]
MLKDNILEVEKRIQMACDKAGRDRSEVTLIAVSKTKPSSMIREAYDLGIKHFGENRVQELSVKYDELNNEINDVHWHMIGHLQRNKVKHVVDKAVLIHSVDSLRLAQMIDQEAAKKDIICDVLIEVNMAKEDTKFGVFEEDLWPLFQEIINLPNIRIRGLMTIAPFVTDPEKNRDIFKKMRELYVDIKTKTIDNVNKEKTGVGRNFNFDPGLFNILSMGMTGDFEVAIEEGATMVRIGTGIFGGRN